MRHFSTSIRVYYEDTDVGGIVYHANYLKFMERARTEWLRSIGCEQPQLLAQNIAFAVVSADIQFKKPARFNDELIVSCQLMKIGHASLQFEQKITLKQNNNLLLSQATIKVACVNLDTMSPRAFPSNLLEDLTCDI